MSPPICPECGAYMRHVGDDGLIYSSIPAQQRYIYACDKDKVRTSVFVTLGITGTARAIGRPRPWDDYREVRVP